MVTLRDLMNTDVQSVHPTDSLRDAADLLTAEHITGVPVTEGGKVIGVLSSTDVLHLLVSTPGAPVRRDEGDGSGALEEPARDPDLDEEGQGGSVYFTDLWENVGGDVLERFHRIDRPEWDVLEEHRVSEAMSRGLFALGPDTPADEAARYILEHDIHRVLVLEDDELVGVATTTDLVRAVAEHGLGA